MKTRILTILALVVLGSRPALIHAQAYSEFSVDSMFSVFSYRMSVRNRKYPGGKCYLRK